MRRNPLLPLVAALTLAGCNAWLTEAPEDFFTPTDFPATEPDLKIALAGIDVHASGCPAASPRGRRTSSCRC